MPVPCASDSVGALSGAIAPPACGAPPRASRASPRGQGWRAVALLRGRFSACCGCVPVRLCTVVIMPLSMPRFSWMTCTARASTGIA